MTNIPAPHHHTLNAALGWLGLGLPADAQTELDRLPVELRTHPIALEAQFAVHAEQQAWDMAFVVADTTVRLHPELPGGWIHRAYAARRKPGGSLEEAFAALLPAFDKFPDESVIPYNLACYRAQQGDLEAAWDWFEAAVRADDGDMKQLKARAIADDDLKPLWPKIAALQST